MLAWCSLALILLSLSVPALCARQIRTIDDTTGDSVIPGNVPIYSPSASWNIQPGCNGCRLQPNNMSMVFNRSWHDGTHSVQDGPKSVQFSFTGVALSVFCILPPKNIDEIIGQPGTIINYNLAFTLDGRSVGPPFVRTQDQLTNEWQYNVSVITLDGLENREHTFVMEMASTKTDSVTLFDYASYV
ncbi:hypothetical protein V5O48_011611 [Marasmius crinis-equi]|uniref:Uncharacterized protein n=1 Tax=Marasmius crinis-equi TaxID=585013 RepID=A0ABR3F536_9AGAR